MKIENLSEPFHHTIIYDYYNSEEEKLIWQELEFLNKKGKLLPPLVTGDPNASPNKVGVFLNKLYRGKENFSNILNISKKIYKIKKLLSENIFANYLNIIDYETTMISYYEDESYYLEHHDCYVLSSVTTFWKTPKQFSGGNLIFTKHRYCPKMDHNTMILFPSYEIHEVSDISMEVNDGVNGRYTINQFYAIASGIKE